MMIVKNPPPDTVVEGGATTCPLCDAGAPTQFVPVDAILQRGFDDAHTNRPGWNTSVLRVDGPTPLLDTQLTYQLRWDEFGYGADLLDPRGDRVARLVDSTVHPAEIAMGAAVRDAICAEEDARVLEQVMGRRVPHGQPATIVEVGNADELVARNTTRIEEQPDGRRLLLSETGRVLAEVIDEAGWIKPHVRGMFALDTGFARPSWGGSQLSLHAAAREAVKRGAPVYMDLELSPDEVQQRYGKTQTMDTIHTEQRILAQMDEQNKEPARPIGAGLGAGLALAMAAGLSMGGPLGYHDGTIKLDSFSGGGWSPRLGRSRYKADPSETPERQAKRAKRRAQNAARGRTKGVRRG